MRDSTFWSGEYHGQHKLTEKDVKDIRAVYATGAASCNKIAIQRHVNSKTIWQIVHHVTWKHVL